jgi:hypothetical protein
MDANILADITLIQKIRYLQETLSNTSELVMFLAWLGPKALALAWPKGALAFKNHGLSQSPQLKPGSGLAWPKALA